MDTYMMPILPTEPAVDGILSPAVFMQVSSISSLLKRPSPVH